MVKFQQRFIKIKVKWKASKQIRVSIFFKAV